MAKNELETDAGTDKRANYDVTLKLHLRALISLFSFRLGEIKSVEAEDFQSFVEQNVEFNEFIQRRVDGFFKLTRKDGRVFYLHIEVQAFPYKKMRWRMLFYCSMIGLAYDRRPTQLILYIGEPDPRWKHTIPFRKGLYDYEVVTFYETPSEVFLKAPEPELWAYAILGAHADT